MRFAAALVVVTAAGFLPASAAAAEYVPGEVLVRFQPGLESKQVRQLADAGEAEVERRLPLVSGLRLLDLDPGEAVPEAVEELEAMPGVIDAEPNWKREPLAIPSDPEFAFQWALLNTGQTVFGVTGSPGADIRATGAWDTQTGSPGVTVAVVDTGISFSHPDLDSNIWSNPGEVPGNGVDDDANGYVDDSNGWDFVNDDNNPDDSLDLDQGHGTHIAGTIGAETGNGEGIAGINWDVSLMPLRTPLTLSGEIDAFFYAIRNGARVINFSAGSHRFAAMELAAINSLEAVTSNVLFVVAAGNERLNNDADPVYPCSHNTGAAAINLICVAATNQHDQLSSYSNFGPTTVDLGAPGDNILSAYPAGAFTTVFADRFSQLPLAARWTTGGRGFKWRLTRRLGRGFSIADSPKGRYRNRSNTWIRSAPLNLSNRRNCTLSYFAKVRTEKGDVLVTETSRDGLRNWRKLRRAHGRRRGNKFAFFPRSFDGDDSVFVRFRLRTDRSVRKDGVYIDDVSISCETSANTYAFLTGTSFSAPHVAGAAALVLAQNPAFGVSDVRNALLGSVDPLPSLAGKTATGGRLNIDAALP